MHPEHWLERLPSLGESDHASQKAARTNVLYEYFRYCLQTIYFGEHARRPLLSTASGLYSVSFGELFALTANIKQDDQQRLLGYAASSLSNIG